MKKVLFLLIAALLLGVGNVSAQPKKAHKKAKAPVAAKAQPRCFTGTYENTGNGILTDYLALEVNEETNEVVGTFKDGTGVVTNLKGVTGTFKRTSDKYIPIQGDAQPEVEKAGNTTLEEAAEKVRRAAAAGGPVF